MDDVTVSQPGESITVIALHGEHDLGTASEMAVLLDDAISSSNLVVVDVTSAQFIDSSFLHNLVKAHRGAQNARIALRAANGDCPDRSQSPGDQRASGGVGVREHEGRSLGESDRLT